MVVYFTSTVADPPVTLFMGKDKYENEVRDWGSDFCGFNYRCICHNVYCHKELRRFCGGNIFFASE